MSTTTAIQWTDATWNIAVGCTKVDEDCKNCYMYRDSLKGSRYDPRTVRKTKTVFNLPLRLKEPSKIFTCSLTDFFHEGIDDFRDQAWDIIRRCPQHTFQILTKRPERIVLPAYWPEIKDRVWLGVSAGSVKGLERIDVLKQVIPDKDKPLLFLSAEPLYEDIKEALALRIDGLDWVITGGESGNENGPYRYRPCEPKWLIRIRNLCVERNVPLFVKQMGTYISKLAGMSDRHGSDMNEFPWFLRLRQFPKIKNREI